MGKVRTIGGAAAELGMPTVWAGRPLRAELAGRAEKALEV